MPCTEENLRAAHQYVSDLEKNWLGGTELWRALEAVYLLCEPSALTWSFFDVRYAIGVVLT